MSGTFHAHHEKPNGDAAAGEITITVNTTKQVIRDPVGNVVFQGPMTVKLVDGQATLTLPASDDDTLEPTGFTYTVTEKLNHVSRTDYRTADFQIADGVTVHSADLAGTLEVAEDPSYGASLNGVLNLTDPTFAANLSASFDPVGQGAQALAQATGLGNQLTKHGVIFGPGEEGTFDAEMVEFAAPPFIDPATGRLAAVYTGYGYDDEDVLRASIGVVFSDDGVDWDTHGRHQILTASLTPGSQYEDGLTAPSPLLWNGSYYVFACGLTEPGYEGGTNHNIVLFSSDDLTAAPDDWTDHGVVMAPSHTAAWRYQNLWLLNFVVHGGTIYGFINASRADFSECIGLFEATHPLGPWTARDDISPLLAPLGAGTKEETITANPMVEKIPGGWRMGYYGVGDGGAYDFFATTTDEDFPGGWVRGNGGEPILSPGPSGSADELYAHKGAPFSFKGRRFHPYCAVMAGDTNRRVALACDPPLPANGATRSASTPTNVTGFCHVITGPGCSDYNLSTGYAVPTGFQPARVQAKAGDLLYLTLAFTLNNGAGDVFADAVTLQADGTTGINFVSGLGGTDKGVPEWLSLYGGVARYDSKSGPAYYKVEEEDLINGVVTLAPVLRIASGARIVYNSAPNLISFTVRNLSAA